MSDAIVREYAKVHALSCPTDIGELRKLINGLLIACEREGRPVEYDDEVQVVVEDRQIVLRRV